MTIPTDVHEYDAWRKQVPRYVDGDMFKFIKTRLSKKGSRHDILEDTYFIVFKVTSSLNSADVTYKLRECDATGKMYARVEYFNGEWIARLIDDKYLIPVIAEES